MGDPLSTPPRQPPGPPPTTSNEQPPEPGQPAGPPPSRPPADGPPPLKTYQRRRRKPMGPPPATQKEGQLSGHSSGDENILPVKNRLFSGDGGGYVGPLPKYITRFSCIQAIRCGSSNQSTSRPTVAPAVSISSDEPTSPRSGPAEPSRHPSPLAAAISQNLPSSQASGHTNTIWRAHGPTTSKNGPTGSPQSASRELPELTIEEEGFSGGDGDNDEPPPPEAFAWP